MPYYNNPMAAYPGGYGMPGGYGQPPYFGGGVQTQAPQRYEIVHVAGEAGIWFRYSEAAVGSARPHSR